MAKKPSAKPCTICGEYCTGKNTLGGDALCMKCMKIYMESKGYVEELEENHLRKVAEQCYGRELNAG